MRYQILADSNSEHIGFTPRGWRDFNESIRKLERPQFQEDTYLAVTGRAYVNLVYKK